MVVGYTWDPSVRSVVGFRRVPSVQSCVPWGSLGCFGLFRFFSGAPFGSLGLFGVFWFIWARPGVVGLTFVFHWLFRARPMSHWGSFGSYGRAMGVVGLIWLGLVHVGSILGA